MTRILSQLESLAQISAEEKRGRIKREEEKERPALICAPALDGLPVLPAHLNGLVSVCVCVLDGTR